MGAGVNLRGRLRRLEASHARPAQRVACPFCTAFWASVAEVYGGHDPGVIEHEPRACEEWAARLVRAYGRETRAA